MTRYPVKLYLSLFIGLLWVIAYFWVRFLRTRLPRDIPFNLSLLQLFILLWLCIIFAWIIKRTLYPKPSSIFPIIQPYLYRMGRPLRNLDYLIRKRTRTMPRIMMRLIKPFPYGAFSFLYGPWKISIFDKSWTLFRLDGQILLFIMHFIIPSLLPKVIIVLAFSIDVFYFHRLELFYSFIWLGIIPLLHRYFIYNLEETLKDYLEYLEEYRPYFVPITPEQELELKEDYVFCPCIDEDKKIYDTTRTEVCHTMGDFIIDKTLTFPRYGYKCDFTLEAVEKYLPERYSKLRYFKIKNDGTLDKSILTKEEIDILEKLFYTYAPLLLILEKFIFDYKNMSNRLVTGKITIPELEILANNDPGFLELYDGYDRTVKRIRIVNAMIFGGYLLGWIYILSISIPNFHVTQYELAMLQGFQDIYDPFTDIFMQENEI